MVYRNPYNGYSEGEYGGYSQEEYTTDYSRGAQDLRGPTTTQDRYYGTQVIGNFLNLRRQLAKQNVMNANTYYCFAGNRGMHIWEKDSLKANKPLHETFFETIMFLLVRLCLVNQN